MSLKNVGHPEILELLPWYVNATLDEDERRRVEVHLSTCETCRREVQTLGEIARVLQAEPAEPGTDLLERTRGRLQPRGMRRWIHSVHRLLLPVPPYARVLLVVQMAAILALAGALILPPPLTTLSDGSPPVGPSVRVQVIFRDTATMSEIRHSLAAVGGRIIDGPTPMSVVVIEMPVGGRAPVSSAHDAIGRLRAFSFIEFAEVIEERR